jgi:hypothetical protein
MTFVGFGVVQCGPDSERPNENTFTLHYTHTLAHTHTMTHTRTHCQWHTLAYRDTHTKHFIHWVTLALPVVAFEKPNSRYI